MHFLALFCQFYLWKCLFGPPRVYLQTNLGQFRTIKYNFRHFRTFKDNLGHYRTLEDTVGHFRIIQVGLLLCHSLVYHHGVLQKNQLNWLRNGWNVGSNKAVLLELKNFCCLDTEKILVGAMYFYSLNNCY